MEYCICSIYTNTTDGKQSYINSFEESQRNTDNESIKGNKSRESNISRILWAPSAWKTWWKNNFKNRVVNEVEDNRQIILTRKREGQRQDLTL